jgi:C-terminal processing protease CtpA/Prc
VRAGLLRDGRRTEVSIAPAAGSAADLIDTARLRDQLSELAARLPLELNQALGPTPRLGATVQELTPDLAAYFGAKDGVLVSAVAAGSAAAAGGLRAGDVITSLDGAAVGSRVDLVRGLREAGSDGRVRVGVVRDRKETTLEVKVESIPSRSARPGRPL